jgi:hypothetical protein
MNAKLVQPIVLLASAALLTACIVQPAGPPAAQRPPEPEARVEVVPPAPAQGYQWVKGHYRWDGNQWVWVEGHWVTAY